MESVERCRSRIAAPGWAAANSPPPCGRCGSRRPSPRRRRSIWPWRRRRNAGGGGPILLLWFASPLIAWWISRPLARREAALSGEQTLFLRALSRRTWAFFDTFVGPEDHWLPPDNYQEYRVAAVAHRTSPTNIGLALLANLSAYDFGYLPAGQLIERTANTLRTMDGLERIAGTSTTGTTRRRCSRCRPYISTVDSGNLAGHLLTLRAGLLALADDRILDAAVRRPGDTLRILADGGGRRPVRRRRHSGRNWNRRRRPLRHARGGPVTPCDVWRARRRTASRGTSDAAGITAPADPPEKGRHEAGREALLRQCRAPDELTFLAPGWRCRPHRAGWQRRGPRSPSSRHPDPARAGAIWSRAGVPRRVSR
jgi:cyclic beta-1,2-glucan synthetase